MDIRFQVKDAQGNLLDAVESRAVAISTETSGKTQKVFGNSSYRLDDGRDLDALDDSDDKFRIVQSGEIVTKA